MTLTQRYAMTPTTSATETVPVKGPTDATTEVMKTISEEDWQHLLACLRFLLDKVSDNDSWSQIGYGLLSLQASDKPVERLWLDFSSKAVGYEPGAAEAWWASHHGQD